MKKATRRLPPLLIATLVIGALVYAFRPRPVEVDIAAVGHGPLEVTVREDGKTRIRDRYVVSAPLAGKLERIQWHSGDPVHENKDILAVIVPADPELLDPRARAQAEAKVRAAEALRSQAEAQLQRARVAHEYAKTDLERVRKLYQSNVTSHQEFDNAEERELTAANSLKAAEFGSQVAEFELEQARAVLLRASGNAGEAKDWRHEIRAPISGRVLRVFQESSAVVTAGTKLLELGNATDLEIETDVLSTEAVRIKPGARVIIEHWGGEKPLEGRVRTVEPSAFTKISALGVEEQRVNVIIDFTGKPEERATLGDGFRVETRIVVWDSPHVLRVPSSALFKQDQHWAVFVVEGDRARLREVDFGRSNDEHAEVLSGLREGERVVIYPSDRVEDGALVKARGTH